VLTQFIQSTYQSGGSPATFSAYDLNFRVTPEVKLPVAVQLTAGPNVVVPVDIGNYCPGCGDVRFFNEVFLGGATPTTADAYTYTVKYSDGSTWTEHAQVVGWGNTNVVAGPGSIPTNLAPTGTVPGETHPNFSWTYPSNTTNILFGFWLCCGNYGTVWSILGYNSSSSGFTAAQIPGLLT
jgi:hypothetical protein